MKPGSAEWQAKWLALAQRADKLHARQAERLTEQHRAEVSAHLDVAGALPELRAQIAAIHARVDGRARLSEADKLRAAFGERGIAATDRKREQLLRARHAVRFGTEQNT